VSAGPTSATSVSMPPDHGPRARRCPRGRHCGRRRSHLRMHGVRTMPARRVQPLPDAWSTRPRDQRRRRHGRAIPCAPPVSQRTFTSPRPPGTVASSAWHQKTRRSCARSVASWTGTGGRRRPARIRTPDRAVTIASIERDRHDPPASDAGPRDRNPGAARHHDADRSVAWCRRSRPYPESVLVPAMS